MSSTGEEALEPEGEGRQLKPSTCKSGADLPRRPMESVIAELQQASEV